jgi:hypothetical protein
VSARSCRSRSLKRADLEAVRRTVEEIQLLAPLWVYLSALMVRMYLEQLDDWAVGPDEKWHEAGSELASARREFLERAKRDLGTPTGVMSRWQERRYRLRKKLGLVKRIKKPTRKESPRDLAARLAEVMPESEDPPTLFGQGQGGDSETGGTTCPLRTGTSLRRDSEATHQIVEEEIKRG